MKKAVALLLALVLCLSLCACGGTTDDSSIQTGNATENGGNSAEGISDDATLTVCLGLEPDFLITEYGNPTIADMAVTRCLYDTLFTQDENGAAVPSVAESYEWIDDTHLRLNIRSGVTAFDGTELNANDVLYTLQVGNTGNYATYYQMYLNVDNCVVEDDFTIVVELAAPNPTIMNLFSDVGFNLLDESSVEANGGVDASAMYPQGGTGRYNITEWKVGQYIMLERNDNYWGGTDDCYYKYIRFTWVSDTASRALNVKSGDANVAIDLSYSDVISLIDDPDINVFHANTARSVVVTFNCAEGLLFDNAKLREAVYYAIKAEDCAEVLYHGYSDTIETAVPTTVYYYYDQSGKIETSIEKAKACLAEAGYPNGFEFTLTVEPGAGYDVVAELMQAQLLEAGITMIIDKVEIVDYFTNVAGGNYHAYIGTLTCADPTTFLNQCDGRKDYLASHGGTAYFGDEMNEWIDRCYSTDSATSLEAFQKVQEIAFDEHIYVGVSNTVNFEVTSSNITNCVIDYACYPIVYYFRPAA